jgi:hypothetical protein
MNARCNSAAAQLGALAILDSGKLTLYNGAPNKEAGK